MTTGEVRKVVTVVFTDLVGSTALGERLDPETVRHVMSRYFDAMQATLERHGGTVEKFVGDAIMTVFGIPTLHEDDALRAVRAAVEMRDRLSDLNAELERDYAVAIEARTGVSTGEVVTGDAASAQKLATGDAVNVAARLEQSASTGEILVGEATFALVCDAVRAEPVDPLTVKGKSEPLAAWRVVGVVGDARAFEQGPLTPFVGRERELTALRGAFDRAVGERTCTLATIVGPPGIGKTRLARELITSLGDEVQVVLGRCLAYGEGVTYAPLAEIVAQVGALSAALAGEPDAAAIEARCAAALGSSDATASPEEVAWAFRRLFEALGRERPLVVVVDDIHWAEPVLLDLLEYVLGFSSGAAILLVCQARADLFEVRPSWAAPRPNASLVSLEPLTDEESQGLIARLARERELSRSTTERIVAAAEGFPLFVEQMLALHADDPDADVSVPPTIQALLAARIDRLDPAERDVLVRASVEGRLFHRGAVAELLSEDTRVGVGTHLLSLVRKEFLRPDRALFAGDDGFRFSHVLIRDAAYNSTPKQLRAELHEGYARWLDARLGDQNDEYVEIVGHHLEQAWRYRTELGSPGAVEAALAREAGERLWAAARNATVRMEFPSAVGLYARAVELLLEEPTGALLQEFGAALNRGLDPRARGVIESAIERARTAGNREVEFRARLDSFWIPPVEADAPQLQYETMLRGARELIPDLESIGDDLSLTKAWQLAAMGDMFGAGQNGAAAEDLQRARIHARRLGDRLEESEIRVSLLVAAYRGDMPVADALRLCEDELREAAGEWMVEAAALACSGGLLAMQRQFDPARERLDRSARLCDEFNVPNVHPWIWRRDVELLAGNPAGAEHWLRLAESEFTRLQEWWGFGFDARTSLADVLCSQGRYEEAAHMTESLPAGLTDWFSAHVRWCGARAKALARLGRPDEALALAHGAVALAEPSDELNTHGDALLARADVLAVCGRDEEAARSAGDALRLYERKGNAVMAERARKLGMTALGSRSAGRT